VSSAPSDDAFINALRTTFGKRPIIFGEDPARYDRLLALVAEEVKPRTMREWLLVKDIVDAEWEFSRIRGFKASALNGALFSVLCRKIRGGRDRLPSKEAWYLSEQQFRVLNDTEGARESLSQLLAEHHFTMDGIATAVFQEEMSQQGEIDQHAEAARSRRNRAYAELESLREKSAARANTPSLPSPSQNGRAVEAPSPIVPHPSADLSQDLKADQRSANAEDAGPTGEGGGRVDDERRP
jgi:hypothetical protein